MRFGHPSHRDIIITIVAEEVILKVVILVALVKGGICASTVRAESIPDLVHAIITTINPTILMVQEPCPAHATSRHQLLDPVPTCELPSFAEYPVPRIRILIRGRALTWLIGREETALQQPTLRKAADDALNAPYLYRTVRDGRPAMGTRFLAHEDWGRGGAVFRGGFEPADEAFVAGEVAARGEGVGFVH
jgi:hypothetical protein